MAQAVTRRILSTRSDLLSRYGVEAVSQAIDDVTQGDDWEEIGSSDVSTYVRYVEDYLRDHHGSREEMADRRPFAEQGVSEMDSQGYRGHRGDEDPGKGPEKVVKPAKTKDVAKDAEKELTKAMDKAHKKGVAEGTEQVYKVLAVDKSNALSDKVMLTVKAGSIAEVFERLAMSDWYPLSINGAEVIDGRRLKPGVAEGSEQVYKVIAVDKNNALGKKVKLNVKASSVEEVFERLAMSDWYPLEINGVEVIAGKRLKQGVAENQRRFNNVNDDDLYAVDPRTKEIIAHLGNPYNNRTAVLIKKRQHEQQGHEVMSGMRAKFYRDVDEQGVAEGTEGNWYVRVKGKVLKDSKFNAIPFASQDEARNHALTLARKKNIPLSQVKLTRSWMDAPESEVSEGESQTVEVVISDGTQRQRRRVRVSPNTRNVEAAVLKYYAKVGLPVVSINGRPVRAAMAEGDGSTCPECGGPIFKSRFMAEEQDACYRKVKSRYKVWPSAYASGALVQCRKKGAANWGTGGKKK